MSISKREFDALFKRKIKELGGGAIGEQALADELGVTIGYVRNIVACREVPSKKTCKYFGLKPVKYIRFRYDYLTEDDE